VRSQGSQPLHRSVGMPQTTGPTGSYKDNQDIAAKARAKSHTLTRSVLVLCRVWPACTCPVPAHSASQPFFHIRIAERCSCAYAVTAACNRASAGFFAVRSAWFGRANPKRDMAMVHVAATFGHRLRVADGGRKLSVTSRDPTRGLWQATPARRSLNIATPAIT
jgi:hypothetical protein